jgi:hypothetical protein
MTMPDESKKKPGERFRTILSESASDREEVTKTQKSEILNQLPRLHPTTPPAKAEPSAPQPGAQSGPLDRKERYLRALWTFASVMSLVVNAVLIVVLIAVLQGVGGLNVMGFGSGLLGGLYSNFEKMDAATIKASIPVNANIPLNLSIPVRTTTGITLAQDALIQNAHVKIATSTFNIDSNADVTLPAGTALSVVLNFNVPVQEAVPVSLNVPVNIPLKDTELHPAITGLENTIKPLYCIVNPSALSINGAPVCSLQ